MNPNRTQSQIETQIDRDFLSICQNVTCLCPSRIEFLDWKGLIGGGLIRGFTQIDMDSLSICVSICDCVLLG